MQIDCEVINAHLVNVKEINIPAHLRQRNVTSADPRKHPAPAGGPPLARVQQMPYRPYFVKSNHSKAAVGKETKMEVDFDVDSKVNSYKEDNVISLDYAQSDKKYAQHKVVTNFP